MELLFGFLVGDSLASRGFRRGIREIDRGRKLGESVESPWKDIRRVSVIQGVEI
jgi:hypothetical protein